MTSYFGILPREVLSGALWQRTLHPRTGIPSLFLSYTLPNSRTSILEVQAVAPHNQRSWFLDEEIVADGQMLVMTPVDPAFLLVPILKAIHPTDGTPGSFRPADDLLEDAAAKLSSSSDPDPSACISASEILRFAALPCVRSALRRVCDVKKVTEEITVYRFSPPKLTALLQSKVAHLTTNGVVDKTKTVIRALARDGLMEDGKEALLALGRTKAACDLVGQYLPPDVHAQLLASYDFTPLTTYLSSQANEAAAALASSTTAPKVKTSNKEEKGPGKGNGKRKASGASTGVEKLKKANVSGMRKLSSFFGGEKAKA